MFVKYCNFVGTIWGGRAVDYDMIIMNVSIKTDI